MNLIKNSYFRDSSGDGIPDMFTQIGTLGLITVAETPLISSRSGNTVAVNVLDAAGSGIYQIVALDNGDYILSLTAKGSGIIDVIVKIEEVDINSAVGDKLVEKNFRMNNTQNIEAAFTLNDPTKTGVKISIYAKEMNLNHNFSFSHMQVNPGSVVTPYEVTTLNLDEILNDRLGV